MAQTNARKVFNFAIEIEGIDQLLIQEVKLPEVEIEAVLHGATNYDVKTAGGVAVSDAELKKTMPAPEGDTWAWDWMLQAQDTRTGSGSLAEQYKRDIIVKELGPDGKTLNAWRWVGAWARKCSKVDFKRGKQSENVIETVTVSVDRVEVLF